MLTLNLLCTYIITIDKSLLYTHRNIFVLKLLMVSPHIHTYSDCALKGIAYEYTCIFLFVVLIKLWFLFFKIEISGAILWKNVHSYCLSVMNKLQL